MIFFLHCNAKKIYLRKSIRNILKFFLIVSSASALYFGYIFTTEQIYFHWNYVAFVQQHSYRDRSSGGCLLPRLDPWDDRAKRFYFQVTPIVCKQIQLYLTELTIYGILQWNRSDIISQDVKTKDLECYYQEFTKKIGDDEAITKFEKNFFTGKAQLETAFVIVECQRSNELYYINIHTWIPPKVYSHLPQISNGDSKPNVQIFMLDAVSQSNFIRQLPMTYKVLTEEMSSVVLKGLIKVGQNTYPNLGALLTGKNVRGQDLPSKKHGFDDWPFIWKNFSRVGYVTSLAEDMPDFTAFNYLEKGFYHQPTDYYMRPFWLAMIEKYYKISGRSSEHCFGNIAEHRLILDFIKQSITVFKNYSYFTLTSLGALSHDELNLVQVLDVELSKFFQWFHQYHSHNTILIVMSDHGINFGSFRWSTQLGRIEATMPFFAISLSEKLRVTYPHLEKNLRINRHRMSSWFDAYDLLMDIVTKRFDKPRKQWSQFGNSLFYPLPKSRTCEEAGIPPEYCPCEEEIQLSPNATNLDIVASDIVKYVNDLLKNSPQCSPLKLSSINNAVKIIPNTSTAKAKGFQNVYRLTIVVDPNGAVLEATMKSDAWSDNFVPVGTIVRVNKFGNTTNCIHDRILSHYCCCHC